MRSSRLLAVVMSLVTLPTISLAQGKRWERQVRDQLERALSTMQQSSSGKGRLLKVGPLNTDETESVMVELRAGATYQALAVCDEDCSGLHLLLSTASGDDLAVDRSSETFPVLRFTPSQAGFYRLRVVMAGCRLNPCWYGVGLRGP